MLSSDMRCFFFFFQAEDGIRDYKVTGSSDVCSSDLIHSEPAGRATVIRNAVLAVAALLVLVSGSGPSIDGELSRLNGTQLALVGTSIAAAEIGRASCRERV